MNKLFLFIIFISSFAALKVNAQPEKRIYIANDDHTDLMWTADVETYENVFVEMLDYYLDLADETDNNISPYKSRFNADGSYWLWTYEHKKSQEKFNRLINRIKDGSISAPLTALVSCYGAQPLEAVLRGMYYSGRLERKYDLRFTQAVAMENQGMPLGLASVWAGAGAKYSWRGICGCASRMNNLSWYDRDNEIYWACGHDNQKLLMKWHSLYSGKTQKSGAKYSNQNSGGYAEAFDPVSAINFLDSDSIFLQRYRAPGMNSPFNIRGAFGFGWDALNRKTGLPYLTDSVAYPQTKHFHEIAQEYTTAERQVIASNQEDFFTDFEKNYGHKLPEEFVSYGNEWDLYSASMIETSAKVKRSVEKLRSAEALATLVSLKDPELLLGLESSRDLAFMNLGLYWEHDWTADGPISNKARAEWQEKIANEITDYTETLYSNARNYLGEIISKNIENQCFYVFNQLGWIRSDVADVKWEGAENIHVWDISENIEVPHQFVTISGEKFLRIHAKEIPSTGYKVFEVREGKGKITHKLTAVLNEDGNIIENNQFKIEIASDGSIRSIIHKDNPDFDYVSKNGISAFNEFQSEDVNDGKVSLSNNGNVSVTVNCKSNTIPAFKTSITLFHNSDRIDIQNEITENFNDVRHWSFGFNQNSPVVHTEEVGAIIKVKTASEGGDYANRNARYDYATINHFADISDGVNGRGVSISSPDLSFVKIGNSTPDHLDTKTPELHVLAGGQVDKGLGIKAQNDAAFFLQRFSLLLHDGYNATESMKFGMEHQNPLVTGFVTGTSKKRNYPSNQFSLLTINQPDVLLWALKAHDDGIEQGVVARVWNQSDRNQNIEMSFGVPINSAERLTHIETPLEELPLFDGTFKRKITSNRIETFRFNLDN